MDNKQKELERFEQELLAAMKSEEKAPETQPEAAPDPETAYANVPEAVEQELLTQLLPEEPETQPEPEKEEPPIPAFEDPDRIVDPKEPLVYCNFSNDYGKGLAEALKEEEPEPAPAPRPRRYTESQRMKDDRVIIGLMLAVSILCVGILGVLIYWLETLLRLL